MPRPSTQPAAAFLARTLVLIPALDEEACVADTVNRWKALGVRRVRVVDNGSRDATSAVASAAGAEVLPETRRGYGAAAWKGLQDWPGDCEWVLFSSADGSDRLSLAEAENWQRVLDNGAEMVLGDRTAMASASRLLKPTQRLGNWICCVAIAAGWGRRFRDMASLRLVRHEALKRMGLRDRAFGWNVEMQVRALELRLPITELPVDYFPRQAGDSKISGSFKGTLRAGVGILRMLCQLWRLRAEKESRLALAVTARSH